MGHPYFTMLLALCLLSSYLAPAVRAQEGQPAGSVKPAVQVQTKQPEQAGRQQTAALPDKQIEKIKRVVRKVGMGEKLTVYMKNGDDLHGKVMFIGEDYFDIAEVDFNKLMTINYADVQKVREGYGEINLLTGKRNNRPRGLRIASVVAVFATLAIPLIVLAAAKD